MSRDCAEQATAGVEWFCVGLVSLQLLGCFYFIVCMWAGWNPWRLPLWFLEDRDQWKK